MEACDQFKITAALERSRSGDGGHVWIFFEDFISDSLARQLGFALLTYAMEIRHQISFDSYDRFFPNQDTLPKGGFGNLIALPLQKVPRENGNSVFLDQNFNPHPDQWLFLSQLKKISLAQVENIVQEAIRRGWVIDSKTDFEDESSEAPWIRVSSNQSKEELIIESLSKEIQIILGNFVYIEKKSLPSKFINRLKRLATFHNPDFYKAQAMRFSTFGKPRVISCAEDFPKHIALPRGLLGEVLEFLKKYAIEVKMQDERYSGIPIDISFQGTLRPLQQEASNSLIQEDLGILSTSTAFGKTVVAAWMIAARKVNTLIKAENKVESAVTQKTEYVPEETVQ